MAQNTLGPFIFTVLHADNTPAGFPLLVREQTQTIERPGVVGTAVLRLAQRSQPFEMRSAVDLDTANEAITIIEAYRQSIAQDAFDLVWNGVDIAAVYETQYIVLDVARIQYRRLAGAAGGLTAGLYWVEANWILQPVPKQ
jgi:hypothetical protein